MKIINHPYVKLLSALLLVATNISVTSFPEVIDQSKLYAKNDIDKIEITFLDCIKENADTIFFEERRLNNSGKFIYIETDNRIKEYRYKNDTLIVSYESYSLIHKKFKSGAYYFYDYLNRIDKIEVVNKEHDITIIRDYVHEGERIVKRIDIKEKERHQTEVEYFYDSKNNIIEKEHSVGFKSSDFTAINTYSLISDYDSDNNLTRTYKIRDGEEYQFRERLYDDSGKLEEFNYRNKNWIRSWQCDYEFVLIQKAEGEIVRHLYSYDSNGLIKEISVLLDDTLLAKYFYNYSPAL